MRGDGGSTGMKRILLTLAFATAVSLGGCASALSLVATTFDVEIVPEKMQQSAYKAASVGFTAWEGLQDGVERTGKLPRCTEAVRLLCVPQSTWDKIKGIEKQTSAVIEKARPVIEAGTDDVELLMSIPAAVYDAQAAIAKAKGE